jgi:hypothetical protein
MLNIQGSHEQRKTEAHRPSAWKPWGPTAGTANSVIASILYLQEVSDTVELV